MGIAPLMLDMTFAARLLLIMLPVQAVPAEHILCDILVAVCAQPGLGRLIKFLVAVTAILFELCMSIYHIARQQHFL